MHAIQVSTTISYAQEYGSTALMLASDKGRTEIVQALLAAPGIDVNHANVSISPLTPSHLLTFCRYSYPSY